MGIKIIAAGAGSGKTFRITEELANLLEQGKVQPSGIMATTFTNAAAAELKDRVKLKLLERDKAQMATEIGSALIGTVHSIGMRLIKRFAFEAGVSPEIAIMAEQDESVLFNQSLANMLTDQHINRMSVLSELLGFQKTTDAYEWRSDVKQAANLIRQNNFDATAIEFSKQQSWLGYKAYLPTPIRKESAAKSHLAELLSNLLRDFEDSSDSTKATGDQILIVRTALADLQKEVFPWYHWVKLSKLKPAKKSEELFEPLKSFAAQHLEIFEFQENIQEYVHAIFELAQQAITQYQHFKKIRGLVDYTDMETHILDLLESPEVQSTIARELDLLIVDEFQDTSPLQLAIFLKLSLLANDAIWVGDVKQSIYGFRGAEPSLMQAIISRQGGIRKEDILSSSWRSRPDLVNMVNTIFSRAFATIDTDQVVLHPKVVDDPKMESAIQHWHFRQDPAPARLSQRWYYRAIASELKKWIATKPFVRDKKNNQLREACLGDIAILCRTNGGCGLVAEALHFVGIKAATPRVGLLETKEIQFFLACLKLIFSKKDTIAIAEILLLATDLTLDEIVAHRAKYLEVGADSLWAEEFAIIKLVLDARRKSIDLSVTEICELAMNAIDIQRIVSSWGSAAQRWSNLEKLLSYAKQYEDACNNMYHSATLGGFLLWLKDLRIAAKDEQAVTSDAMTVQVTTYHKSKGLEWPIVLALNLEADTKDKLFGFSIEAADETLDLDLENVLGNRWIRFWLNPYDNLSKNTILANSIEAGKEAQLQRQLALEEEKRLLYVGLTRARDYQIFVGNKDSTKWLNRVYNGGNEEANVFDEQTQESPFFYDGKIIPVLFKELIYPEIVEEGQIEQQAIAYFEPRTGNRDFQPKRLDLGLWSAKQKPKVFSTSTFSTTVITQTFLLKIVVQHYLRIDLKNKNTTDKLQLFADLAERLGENLAIETIQQLVDQIDLLDVFFTKLGAKKDLRMFPIAGVIKEQQFQATIPRLLMDDYGWNLVMYNYAEKLDKKNLSELILSAAVIHQQQIGSIRGWVVYPFQGKIEEVALS